jgi:clan AA aspartic protease (TIGR02281 family)
MSTIPIYLYCRIAIIAWAAITVPPSLSLRSLAAQETSAQKTTPDTAAQKKYPPEVVAKAETVLQESGLRRSGKSIQSTETAAIGRAITNLARDRRELKLLRQNWTTVADRIAAVKQELRRLNAQDIELNLQLSRVADGDVQQNNRLVGLVNVSRAQTKSLIDLRGQLVKDLDARRGVLRDAETAYADTVLAIRDDYQTVYDKIADQLKDKKVEIAIEVMHRNFQSPASVTANMTLAALDSRISKIEAAVFREAIALQVRRNLLLVDVVVGKETIPMVVDSGAAMVVLPSRIAAQLGIEVPLDAKQIQVVMASGGRIPARGVSVPRMRIGGFEAKDVDAVVLDAAAVGAEPLLGLSFLSHFKFEIDQSKKTLKLLRVDAK